MPFHPCHLGTLPTTWPFPFILLELYLPEEWSSWSVGGPWGCSLCLQREWVSWISRHQELQNQGRLIVACWLETVVACCFFSFVALEPQIGLDVELNWFLSNYHRLIDWRRKTLEVPWSGPSVWMTSWVLSATRANSPWSPPWRMPWACWVWVS